MSEFRHRERLGLAAICLLFVAGKTHEQVHNTALSARPQLYAENLDSSGRANQVQGRGNQQRIVAAYEIFEVSLTSATNSRNPYFSGPALTITFTGVSGAAQGKVITAKGFWDGGKVYRVRFAPPAEGEWQWASVSNESAMNGKTGSFICNGTLPQQHVSAHGYVRESQDYPYTFAHADGTPFFLIGDTQWSFSTAAIAWPGEFQSYVNARAAQGFNYVHGVLYQTYPEGNEVNEGGPPFFANDVDSLNPGFWQAFDRRMAYLNSNGMVVGLMLAWGDNAWQLFGDRQQVERFVQYTVNRYAAYNLFWILAGEYEESTPPGGYDFIGNLVRAQDPYLHPVTIHTVDTSADDFGAAPWQTTIYQQIFHAQQITTDRRFSKPVINSEFGYEGDQSAEEVRQDAWEIVMRGGFLVYGDTNTFHYNAVMTQRNLNAPGAAFMSILRNFWTNNGRYGIKWPQFDRFEALDAKRFLAGKVGAEYVVYADTTGVFNIDLSDLNGNIFGHWFDTKTGRWGTTFTGVAGANFSLTPPAKGSAAYLTTRADITPPRILGTPTATRSLADFLIAWRTDEPATSQIEYGLSSNYTLSTPLYYNFQTVHELVLARLLADTVYHYRVLSEDSTGNIAGSTDLTFSTRVAAPETVAIAKVILIDSLDSQTKGQRTGGRFASGGGWQTFNDEDMLMYDLGRYIKKGSLEIDVRNFRPLEQNSKERHHFLSMFRMPWGNHHPIEDLETVWDLHAGSYYRPGLKMLSWTYDRVENNTSTSEDWEKEKTYRLKVVWGGRQLQFFRDGVLQLTHTHSSEMELRYLFIGRDYTLSGDLITNFKHNQYPALGGPIFSNLVGREWLNPADVFPAQISALNTTELYANAARLEWQTQERAVCYVEYGSTPGTYTQRTPALGPAAQSFSAVLTNLEPQKTYYYRIVALDGSRNLSRGAEQAFITLRGGKFLFQPVADAFVERAGLSGVTRDYANFGRMPLVLSEGREIYLSFHAGAASGTLLKTTLRLHSRQSGSSTGVLKRITTDWNENEVTWRTKPTLAAQELARLANTPAGQWQEIAFDTSAAQNRVYDLAIAGFGSQLVSFDARESTNHQPELIVLTDAGDVTPPSLQKLGWQEITPTAATFRCSASEPARVQIEYGLGEALDQTTTFTAMLDTTHVIRLSGLLENAAYQFRVKLVDAAGNASLSRQYVVSTFAQVKELEIASGNGQTGKRGELLRGPLTVKALDANGAGVEHVPLAFDVRYGGGIIFPRYLGSDETFPHQTGADGGVSVRWQLGQENLQIVEAAVLGNPLLSVKFQARMIDITGDDVAGVPVTFSMQQFPNPFHATTQFEVALPEPGKITLKIFDLQGREVVSLIEESRSAGRHLLAWNGRNHVNRLVASGIYFAIASFQQAEPANSELQIRKQRLLFLK